MADRLKKLERELGLAAAPSPFALDPKIICRRVEKTLSAEEAERKSYMKHKLRLAAVLTAAALALTTTALAAGPAINEMLQAALGVFAPYVQELEGEAVHQGLRVRVLSALADSTTVTVYAEITDLTGDRLKDLKRFVFRGELDIELEGENHWSWGTEKLSYDPETKTALVTLTRYMGGTFARPTDGTVTIDYIQPGYHHFFKDENIPLEGLTAQVQPSKTLPTGETVLLPGRERELPTSMDIALAAVGYGSDGRFHTLFRLPDEAILELSSCHALPYTPPTPERANFFWGATEGESGKSDWPKNGSYDINVADFVQDGKKYHDLSYVRRPGGPELPECLGLLEAYIITEEPVEGPWVIPITVQPVESVKSPLAGVIDHSALKELELSSLSVHLTSRSENGTQITGYPLTVFFADGTSQHPIRETASYLPDDSIIAHWRFDRPVEVNDITGVALGCWMIPVEKGIAGEGYWLPALPE